MGTTTTAAIANKKAVVAVAGVVVIHTRRESRDPASTLVLLLTLQLVRALAPTVNTLLLLMMMPVMAMAGCECILHTPTGRRAIPALRHQRRPHRELVLLVLYVSAMDSMMRIAAVKATVTRAPVRAAG